MILLIYPKGKHRVLLCRNNSVLFTGNQYLFAIFDIETVCSTVLADLRMYFCTKDYVNRQSGEPYAERIVGISTHLRLNSGRKRSHDYLRNKSPTAKKGAHVQSATQWRALRFLPPSTN